MLRGHDSSVNSTGNTFSRIVFGSFPASQDIVFLVFIGILIDMPGHVFIGLSDNVIDRIQTIVVEETLACA